MLDGSLPEADAPPGVLDYRSAATLSGDDRGCSPKNCEGHVFGDICFMACLTLCKNGTVPFLEPKTSI